LFFLLFYPLSLLLNSLRMETLSGETPGGAQTGAEAASADMGGVYTAGDY
jgi:hypothetical protein